MHNREQLHRQELFLIFSGSLCSRLFKTSLREGFIFLFIPHRSGDRHIQYRSSLSLSNLFFSFCFHFFAVHWNYRFNSRCCRTTVFASTLHPFLSKYAFWKGIVELVHRRCFHVNAFYLHKLSCIAFMGTLYVTVLGLDVCFSFFLQISGERSFPDLLLR